MLTCLLLLLSTFAAVAGILTPQEQAIADKLAGSARPFIKIDPILTQVARARAKDMASRSYFAHVDPDGHGPNWHVRQAGYQLPDWWGNSDSSNYVESIAAGQTSPNEAWSEWMNSPSHKKHLMAEDDFYQDETSVGVGYYSSSSSEYGTYWVVISAPPQPEPALTITAPAAGAQVLNPQVAVAGKTNDADTSRILFRVENANGTGAFQTATGTGSWNGTATGLVAGKNVIRIRSVDGSGTMISELTRNVTYVVPTKLSVNVSGAGSVSTGFAGSTNRVIGTQYTITAVPAAGQIFAGWSGSSSSKSVTLTFTMTEGYNLTASFVANPFTARRGAYQGLLGGGTTAGNINVSVTPTGAYTGKVVLKGATYAVSGQFNAAGSSTVTLANGGKLALSLDLNGTGGLSGNLTGAGRATVQASATYKAASGAYPKAGRYTVTIPPAPGADAKLPQGNGYGTLTIDTKGVATLTGALADGRAIALSANVTSDDQIAFYAPLYSGAGYLSGSVKLRATEQSDLDGQVQWSKPVTPTAKIYPGALKANLPVIGSRYVKPAQGAAVISGQNNLILTDGNLASPIIKPVTLAVATSPTTARQSVSGFSATINPATGVFTGTFTHPVTKATSTYRGVIFQKQNAGFGYFLGANSSGNAVVAAAQ